MSANPGPRASDLAARQVEQIVSAAQAAAEKLRADATEHARRSAADELRKAQKEAIVLERDARRDAEAILGDAQAEAARVREKARRSVDGRVAAAERAAAEVLEEARALSGGLQQLGKALEAHADRILREVTAAHKRMQADLRVARPAAAGTSEPPDDVKADPASTGAGPARKGAEPSTPKQPSRDDEAQSRRKRRNPFEEMEVPTWVGREQR